MKRLIKRYILAVCSIVLLLGCSDEDMLQQGIVGSEVNAVLHFGATHNEQINIKTRTTYDIHYESMVRNVYVFVFANNDKVYGHYFDESNLNKSGEKEYWTVSNMSSENTSVQTKGTLHMSLPSVSANAEIVLIANIDLDFMNVSQERLGLVRTKDDLNELVVSLNQEIPDRNAGYFMMTGSQGNVSISTDGAISVPGGKIMLRRLDAKVEVNVRINPNENDGRQ